MTKQPGQFAHSVKKGAKQAFPIVLGCVPIGMAYGILTQQAGLSLWAAMGLSLFVFAGASQFMAVSMMRNGMDAGVIIISTLIVNFRHLLMSASVAPHLARWTISQRLLFGGMLTDETFILHSLNFARGDLNPSSAVALNLSVYIAWSAASMMGYELGAMIVNPEAWGLDFALPAMFVGLLLSACKDKAGIAAAVVGGSVSVALHILSAGSWAAFVGALAGATAGTFLTFNMKEGADS